VWKAVKRNLIAALLAVVLLASILAAFLTRQGATPAAPRRALMGSTLPIDDRLMSAARNLAALADTMEEQDLAKDA
jgi:hypothetical protein